MKTSHVFRLINHDSEEPPDPALLARRTFSELDYSFSAEARRFVPGPQLETAMNTAIAVGEPLLITGEPGTGKTQAAYYAAYKLGVEPVIHFQVKSDSTARDLLYHFDTVRYFYDAQLASLGRAPNDAPAPLEKSDYIERRALWEAFEQGVQLGLPQVLLIDEIDKAPRDFPNDLLHELDKMQFTVMETGQLISIQRHLTPIVFITSNSERRLPEPFLRRCVYHHIQFDEELVERAVFAHRDEYANLSDATIKLALQRFMALRDRSLRKRPATGELLVWMRVLSLATGVDVEVLNRDLAEVLNRGLAEVPYLGVLLKDRQDIEELAAGQL